MYTACGHGMYMYMWSKSSHAWPARPGEARLHGHASVGNIGLQCLHTGKLYLNGPWSEFTFPNSKMIFPTGHMTTTYIIILL